MIMAEIGAVASGVQLVDIALRASREVCDFLSAYRSTGKDVKALHDSKCSYKNSFPHHSSNCMVICLSHPLGY